MVAYSRFGHSAGGPNLMEFPDPHTPGGSMLKMIAENHNARPRQVAPRFLLHFKNVFAIPKAATSIT